MLYGVGIFVEKKQTEDETSKKETKRRLITPDKICQSAQLVVQATAYGGAIKNMEQRRANATENMGQKRTNATA